MQKLPKDLQGFMVFVVVLCVALVWGLSPRLQAHSWLELLLFTFLISLATMLPIPDPRGGYITVTPILLYVLLSVHGPAVALVVASFAYALGFSFSVGWQPWRVAFNGAQIGISVGLAGLVFRATGGSVERPDLLHFFLPFVLAAITHQLSNNFLVAFAISRVRGLPVFSTWISEVRELLWSNSLSIPSAALLTILYVSIHPATLLLYLASLPLQRWALQLYLQQRRLHSQAIDSLVVAFDANFPQGKGHSRRVANLSVAIARQLSMSDHGIEGIEMGALLHDVGLIGLDEALDAADEGGLPVMARLREHTRIGWEIAQDLPRRDVAEIVLYHHEKFDGSGYPTGLKGTSIPVGARIVAIAEAFESMTAGGLRSVQRLTIREAIERIRWEAGTAFDPRVVEALVALWESGQLSSGEAPIESAEIGSQISTVSQS